MKKPERPDGQCCKTCQHFIDYTASSGPGEVNGYCSHPFHLTRATVHRAYGGHWTHDASWCDMWSAETDPPAGPRGSQA